MSITECLHCRKWFQTHGADWLDDPSWYCPDCLYQGYDDYPLGKSARVVMRILSLGAGVQPFALRLACNPSLSR